MLVLDWIQTVWHSDSVPERIFLKKLILKKLADHITSMKNYIACKVKGAFSQWFKSQCPFLQTKLLVY